MFFILGLVEGREMCKQSSNMYDGLKGNNVITACICVHIVVSTVHDSMNMIMMVVDDSGRESKHVGKF